MDHESLRTASSYLNNLLLARGLLRNGDPIDFVKPSRDSRAQIINLVHDLILREDRDRDQREHVAITLRNLRADEIRKNADMAKLKEKAETDARNAVQARTAQKTAEAEMKKVERAMKSLQDQSARLKTSLAQVKTQCQNDVRKRDLELARLKTHLHGQQRGNGSNKVAPSLTITGGQQRARQQTHETDVQDPEYSLKQETTEFLTQLSQSLSDENDSLISLVRNAVETLQHLLDRKPHPDSAIGSLGSNESMVMQAAASHPTSSLAAELEDCLAHLKTILNNPNFVTVEEVEVREDEIARLREGWEQMEQRWREVLVMMDGWRQRMGTGDTINLEDLRKGMGLCSPVRAAGKGGGMRIEEAEQSFVGSEDVSEIPVPDMEESFTDERRRSTSGSQGSPKRKRSVLEPPEFFDLRPSQSMGYTSTPASPQLPVPESEDEEEIPRQMTISEKLQEAERAAASAPTKKRSSFGLDGAGEGEDDDTLGQLVAPLSPMVKKTKIRGRPKRRKSTLSPEELEALMVAGES